MAHNPLAKLIYDGWFAQRLGELASGEVPLAKDRIEEIKRVTNNTATHVVFLHHRAEGKSIYYPITNQDELKLANKNIEENYQTVGYDLSVTCRARNLRGEVEIEEYAKNLIELTNWTIEIESQNQFVVKFDAEGPSQKAGYELISKLQSYLICFSVKLKIGFIVTNVHWGPRCKAQPWSWIATDYYPKGPKIIAKDIENITRLKAGGNEKTMLDLVEFYGQISPRTKLITGFSIIETLFDTSAENILESSEIDEIIKRINQIPDLVSKKDKIDKVTNVLRNPNVMSKQGRNERLAVKLAEVMDIKYIDAIKKIKELAKNRGKAAHSTKENEKEFTESSNYIEEVLLRYIYS